MTSKQQLIIIMNSHRDRGISSERSLSKILDSDKLSEGVRSGYHFVDGLYQLLICGGTADKKPRVVEQRGRVAYAHRKTLPTNPHVGFGLHEYKGVKYCDITPKHVYYSVIEREFVELFKLKIFVKVGEIIRFRVSRVLPALQMVLSELCVLTDVFPDFPTRFTLSNQLNLLKTVLQWPEDLLPSYGKFHACYMKPFLLRKKCPLTDLPKMPEGFKTYGGGGWLVWTGPVKKFIKNHINGLGKKPLQLATAFLQGIKRGAHPVPESFLRAGLVDHRGAMADPPEHDINHFVEYNIFTKKVLSCLQENDTSLRFWNHVEPSHNSCFGYKFDETGGVASVQDFFGIFPTVANTWDCFHNLLEEETTEVFPAAYYTTILHMARSDDRRIHETFDCFTKSKLDVNDLISECVIGSPVLSSDELYEPGHYRCGDVAFKTYCASPGYMEGREEAVLEAVTRFHNGRYRTWVNEIRVMICTELRFLGEDKRANECFHILRRGDIHKNIRLVNHTEICRPFGGCHEYDYPWGELDFHLKDQYDVVGFFFETVKEIRLNIRQFDVKLVRKGHLQPYCDVRRHNTPLWEHPLPVCVIPLAEPFKVRTITKGHGPSYFVARPLQRTLKKAMNILPQLVLTTRPLSEIDLHWLLAETRKIDPEGQLNLFCSGDYKAATDKLNITLTKKIFENLLRKFDYRSSILDRTFRDVLYEQVLTYPKWSGLENILQKNGQLMGSILSFPLLCLANLITYAIALEEYLGFSVCPMEYPVLVNGDDILFMTNAKMYSIWLKWIDRSGFKLSTGKNYVHPSVLTVNSVAYKYDRRRNMFSRLNYLNPGLIMGQSKSGNKAEEIPIWDTHNEVCAEAVNPAQASRWFIHYHRNEIDRLSNDGLFNLFLPRYLGGLGFEPFNEVKATNFQLGLATYRWQLMSAGPFVTQSEIKFSAPTASMWKGKKLVDGYSTLKPLYGPYHSQYYDDLCSCLIPMNHYITPTVIGAAFVLGTEKTVPKYKGIKQADIRMFKKSGTKHIPLSALLNLGQQFKRHSLTSDTLTPYSGYYLNNSALVLSGTKKFGSSHPCVPSHVPKEHVQLELEIILNNAQN